MCVIPFSLHREYKKKPYYDKKKDGYYSLPAQQVTFTLGFMRCVLLSNFIF